MQSWVLIFFGAGLGGMLRQAMGLAVTRLTGGRFPFGVLAVNITGCLVMGLIAGWLMARAEHPWAPGARLFLMTGVMGGYTTFSSFALDFAMLWESGDFAPAAAYVAASVILSILALFAGLVLVRMSV